MEYIVQDAQNAADTGRKEIILVAQDTTRYGIDLYGRQMLPVLLTKLNRIKDLKWIRILYTHPAHITDELIHTIAHTEKVANYIDIPLQHTVDKILRSMGRPEHNIAARAIDKLRKQIPDIVIRTSIITGFPGETEKDFKQLLKDIRQAEFDWLGTFTYSAEKGTKAYTLKDKVQTGIKEDRKQAIMELQQGITSGKNKNRIGRKYDILADADFEGHTEFQAPEIDGKIIFNKRHKQGDIFNGTIKAVKQVYDLIA